MDRQRLLRFPPDHNLSHLYNPFEKLPPYQYSQLTFKSFSEGEIRNQAGRDSLPALDATGAKVGECNFLDDSRVTFQVSKVRLGVSNFEYQRLEQSDSGGGGGRVEGDEDDLPGDIYRDSQVRDVARGVLYFEC